MNKQRNGTAESYMESDAGSGTGSVIETTAKTNAKKPYGIGNSASDYVDANAQNKSGTEPSWGTMVARTTEVELRKIIAQFKYRAVPVLVALLPLIVLLTNRSGGVIRFSPENLPYTLLSLAAYVLLPLTACMLAADLFAGERERGELKIPLTRPVSRPALAVGKIAAILIYQVGLLALLLVLSLAAALLSGAGLGDLSLLTVLGAYAVTLLPAAAISAAAAFASTLARSATSGFLLGVLLLLVLNGAGLLFPAAAPMLLTEYTVLYKTVIGSEIAYAQLAMGVGILLGCGTVLTTAQILLFDRREI
ncbi:ABC transporter permease [Saccharibacillus kuerlensis]|uniref:ABC-2 type transport system permease protein n=1 Tax=Saccharibacillus kuerlensis TaxID=459527 RepID=A0ABQ2L6S6_9BACL|nr:ABC transporter permease [Saccharibacillus kuerlensis]GGO05382.1 hypothetical protein GCM10010969_31750 [Saccharibacillus kuerlensis]